MDFPAALKACINGFELTRSAWNRNDKFISVQADGYIYLVGLAGGPDLFHPDHHDLRATDWELVRVDRTTEVTPTEP